MRTIYHLRRWQNVATDTLTIGVAPLASEQPRLEALRR